MKILWFSISVIILISSMYSCFADKGLVALLVTNIIWLIVSALCTWFSEDDKPAWIFSDITSIVGIVITAFALA